MEREPLSHARTDALGMSETEMRRLAHLVADLVVDHVVGVADGPAIQEASVHELMSRLNGPMPNGASSPDESIEAIVRFALERMQHGDHPRYFARVPGPSSFAGVLGDWLSTGFNVNAASWKGGSGPSSLEIIAVGWLAEALGLPSTTEGILTSGGSLANLTALGAARHELGHGTVYLSDQGHSSIVRDLKVLGYDTNDIRILTSNESMQLDPEALDAAIADDLASGRRPTIVVASAGTTNTGTIDPLTRLAAVCRSRGLWLHVDGAYGAPAALSSKLRSRFDGLDLVDSLVLDPHKWLFQPYDSGCAFVTRPGVLERTYAMLPAYLADVAATEGEINLSDRGIELSRRARGIKLWLTLKTYGLDRIREAIEQGVALAEYAQDRINASAEWELFLPASLGVVTFVSTKEGADHAEAARRLVDTGFAAVTSTYLHGHSVLRLCTINPRSTRGDIDETLNRLANLLGSR
jgi:glutamate/tyrosine decarboxylase-like PLP-dependent enzyme